MKFSDIVTIDKDIQSGTPVFKGTRVPIQTLFWHIENGITIEEFLDDFPSVTREQAVQLLELSGKMVSMPKVIQFYETVA
ncbi:MAG TPA: DUF433 domain-containing protein [Pyrinomonadaceae bacterium]|nr:DUF433 domain-containing protein [Pyrinomonadaceae bacterium]